MTDEPTADGPARQRAARAVGTLAGGVLGALLALVATISWPVAGERLQSMGLPLPLLALLYVVWGMLCGAVLGHLSPRLNSPGARVLAGSLVGLATYAAVALLIGAGLVATGILAVVGVLVGAVVGFQTAEKKA